MATRKKSSGTKSNARKRTASPRPRAARGGMRRYFFKMFVAATVAGFLLLGWILHDLPDAASVKPLETKPSITILARDGALIARYGGIKGNTISVKDLPPYVTSAVLAVEDRRFYTHHGIDPRGLARAMWSNIKAGAWVQGGSTITQQLAKNLFLTPEKTLKRKAQEAVMALYIDYKFGKDDILTAYLNRVYFGSGAYGIDAAAKVYFGKPATHLTLWEGAVLAGLLKAPSRFSPAANPKKARDRGRIVIRAMQEAGYLDKSVTEHELKHARIELAGSEQGDLNRYFTDWIVGEIDSLVDDNPGRDLVVRTTFDARFQIAAERATADLFKNIKATEKISQTAVVTLAPDGAVLAMIGGRDYTDSQFNRATQAMRQPGSSFKPFVYLAAIETGYSPTDKIFDERKSYNGYRPENYDGRYLGVVTLTDALALSLNAATVGLLSDIGVSRLLDVTKRLGFTAKLKPELATGLGASEVTLLEQCGAYATIANGGYAARPYAVLSVEDGRGNLLYLREAARPARLFSSADIRDLDRMLVQAIARGTGQAAQLTRGHTAGKTGTSQNYRDAWFIGYTDNLITGVWMGNDDSTPMEKISGGKYPAMLWHSYMQEATGFDLARPEGIPRVDTSNEDFSKMLDRWSSSGFGFDFGGFRGSNDAPQYNR